MTQRTVRVFHGTRYDPQHEFKLLPGLLYGVRNFGFAASYAAERVKRKSGTSAWVVTLDFHFENLCEESSLHALLDKHGIESYTSSAGVFLDHPEFLHVLIDAGYDGLYAHDFGFRSDFEELPVYMVVNAENQARIVRFEQVSDDSLAHDHEPTDDDRP